MPTAFFCIYMEELYQIYKKCGSVVCTDTRNIIKGSLFIALKGSSFDGNMFAENAIESGAAYAVVDNKQIAGKSEKMYLVEDTLSALQQLATYHRQSVNFKVIALTGSNGKTTTKELLASVLAKKYRLHATMGNFNNHIGVPLTLLSVPSETEVVIVEMGANHSGEIALLAQIALPNEGIITNIGKAHLEGFGSIDGVLKAKTELFKLLKKSKGKIYFNNGDKKLNELKEEYSDNTILYNSKESGKYITQIDMSPYLHCDVSVGGKVYSINTHLMGEYNAENILAALTVGIENGIRPEICVEAIQKYIPQNNRSQLIDSGKNKIILDAYNANPTSMYKALSSFKKVSGKNKVIILGEMKETGGEERQIHSELVHFLKNEKDYEQVFLVGNIFLEISDSSDTKIKCFTNVESLLVHLTRESLSDKTILVKGSRTVKLEKVLELL